MFNLLHKSSFIISLLLLTSISSSFLKSTPTPSEILPNTSERNYNGDSDIPLIDNTPYTITSFSPNQQYTFTYESNGNEVITLNTNLDTIKQDVFNQTIEVYHDDKKVFEVYENNNNVIDFTNIQDINGKTPKGVYKVVVYNSLSQENDVNVTLDIMIFKSEHKVIEFHRETHKRINTLRSSNTILQLFARLSKDYVHTNMNCLNIKVGNYILTNKLLRNVYAYSTLVNATTDEQFQQYFYSIEELNTANYSTRINSSEHVQVCFMNDNSFDAIKQKVLFLQIELQSETATYIAPQEITISLSRPLEIINLDNIISYSNEGYIERAVSFKTGIPFYILFKTNGKNDYSYVFTIQHSKISTLYNDYIINKESKRGEYSQSTMYVINKGGMNLYDQYYIEFFSETTTDTNIIIQAIKTEVMFLTNTRQSQTYFKNITNCALPFYIIGKYDTDENNDRYFFVEELSGKHDVLYNNNIDYEYMSQKGILPTSNFELVTQKVLLLTKKTEVIGIKCRSPGAVNIHFIDRYSKSSMQVGERVIGCVDEAQGTKISVSQTSGSTNFNIRGASLSNDDIIINVGSNKHELNKNNGYFFNEQLSSDAKLEITITPTLYQSPMVFEISISKYQDAFTNVTSSQIIPKDVSLLYIPIVNNSTYKKVSISFPSCTTGCAYYFSKGTMNTALSPQVISTDISYAEQLNLIITNPYDKYQADTLLYEDDSPYYFAIWTQESSIERYINITYVSKEDITPIQPGQVIILNQHNTKVAIIGDSNREHYLNIVLKAYYDKKHHDKKNVIKLYYFDDEIDTLSFEDGYHVVSQLNHGFELEIGIDHTEFDYSGVSFSYFFGEEYTSEKVDEINNHAHYILNNKFDNIIQWQETNLTELKDYPIIYEVYVIKQKSEHAEFIDNDIYLLELKDNYTKYSKNFKEGDKDYVYIETNSTQITFNQSGEFVTNVIAVLSGGIPMRLMYDYKAIEKSTFQNKIWFAIIFPCCFVISIILITLSLNADKFCIAPSIPTDNERLVPETLGPNQAPDLSGVEDVSKKGNE